MTRPARLVLLGHPVAHSLSPVMHNAALAAAGIPMQYELLDVPPAALDATFQSLAREGAAGNVTVPHKTAAVSSMTELSSSARRVEAVNTFRASGRGTLIGDNTDIAGFIGLIQSLLQREPCDTHFAVIGAGGTAAAILAAIERWPGCQASVYARNSTRARQLVARFPDVARVETLTEGAVIRGEIVVNATPVGLDSEDIPVALSAIDPGAVVVDLVYKTGETAFVRRARAEGRIATDGLRMLLEQGAAAFQIWFGIQPDRDAMWTALKEATGRR